MGIGIFELTEPIPELREPHALVVLRPWIDAGNSGTLTLVGLEERFGAKELARIKRPGNFFDFTRYRPMMYWNEGVRQVNIPNTMVTWAARKEGNDFIFIHLLEPHMLAELYTHSIVRLLQKLGVRRYCLIGSMYDMVPHTRPLLVTGGAVGDRAVDDINNAGVASSDYQGPVTICHLISQEANELGIESMNVLVHLPQYTELEEDYMGQVRLMEVINSFYGIPVDEDDIERAEVQTNSIDDLVAGNPQMKEIVTHLEAHYDARIADSAPEEMPPLSPEIDTFLKEMEKRFRQS